MGYNVQRRASVDATGKHQAGSTPRISARNNKKLHRSLWGGEGGNRLGNTATTLGAMSQGLFSFLEATRRAVFLRGGILTQVAKLVSRLLKPTARLPHRHVAMPSRFLWPYIPGQTAFTRH